MLCWLASGDHKAEKNDPHSSGTIKTAVKPLSPTPPWEAQMLCWLASGDHKAEKNDPHSSETIETVAQPLSPTPLGRPECFAGYNLVIIRLRKTLPT